MRKFLLSIMLCVTCVLQMNAQVKVLYDTYNTKYYESMTASAPPADNWYAEDFDDSSWQLYTGEVTFPQYDAFWVRSVINISDDPSSRTYTLQLAHDDECMFYVNGNLLHNDNSVCSRYSYYDIPSSYLKQGKNVIAAYCYDSGGGEQYLEFGINTSDGSAILSAPDKPIVSLSKSSLSLLAYDNATLNQKQLTATVFTPEGLSSADVTWSSSDASVATVENGLVKAVSAGTASITASVTIDNVGYSNTSEVTVKALNATGKVVIVETPGTLSTLLTQDEQENTDELTVLGTLNGDDVNVLRFMAGRESDGSVSAGELSVLDLSNANFVGEGSYYTRWDTNDYGTYNPQANEITYGMFAGCIRLQRVILPETVTNIGDYAFKNCNNLEQIVFPNNLAIINYESFDGCNSLESVTIPASVTYLSGRCFAECSTLKNINFEADSRLTNLPSWGFYGTDLKSIIVPQSVEIINDECFAGLGSLTSVEFEEGSKLKKIDTWAFENVNSLETISLPDSLETLGNYVFAGCGNLKTINISENSKLRTIGSNVFNSTSITSFYIPKDLSSINDIGLNTSTITSISIHPENKFYEESAGVVFAKKEKTIAFIPSNIRGTLTLPSYITKITANQFEGRTGLNTLILSQKVTKIGDNAFNGCSGLKTIVSLATTPPSPSDEAFNGITPANIQLIVPEVSLDTYKSTELWSSFTNVIGVGETPVMNLSSTKVSLYGTTNESGSQKQLQTTIYTKDGLYDGTVEWTSSNTEVATVDANGLVKYVGVGSANITCKVTVNGTETTAVCLVNCVGAGSGTLVVVDNPGTLSTLISDQDKYNITDLTILGTLNSTDIRFLRDMAGIDNSNNATAGKLAKLNLQDVFIVSGGEGYNTQWGGFDCDNNVLGHFAFARCTSLEEVILPSSLTELRSYAFLHCTNLKSVTLPNGITNIPNNMCEDCASLESITIPSNVTNISNNAFTSCNSLCLVIALPTTAPSLDSSAFDKTSSNLVVVVPNGIDSYKSADNWKDLNNLYGSDELPVAKISKSKLNLSYTDTEAGTAQLSLIAVGKSGVVTPEITWTSSNEQIAKVSATGVVTTGTTEGSAKITASTVIDGKILTAECAVTSFYFSGKLVNVEIAGTLSTLLSEDDQNDITELKVSGKLNNDDLRIIRYMAGRDEYDNISPGSLEKLDMEDAQIVSGGENGYMKSGDSWYWTYDGIINNYMFRNCASLKRVVLPSGIYSIGGDAFQGCENLETVVLPEGLTSIEWSAFYGCKKLSTINLPSTLTSFSSSVFQDCSNLKSIDLSTAKGLTSIPYSTFYNSGLTEISIPANITSIESTAFYNSKKLEKVTFEEGSKLATIGSSAFSCSKLQTITIPDAVTVIEGDAFNGCSKLEEINISENSKLRTLGGNFISGTSIKKLYIPRQVTSISSQNFPDSVTIEIAPLNKSYEMYNGCLVGKLAKNLAYVPKSIKILNLPEYITTIPSGVLQDHNNLETIVFPAKVSKIEGWGPFSSDWNLREIYCANPEPPTTENNCFSCNTSNVKVYVPEASIDDYKDTEWNEFTIEAVNFKNSIELADHNVKIYNVQGGKEIQLECYIESANGPSNANAATWTSKNPDIVSVDQTGKITFVSEGKTKIIASITLDDDVYSDSCEVEAKIITDPENTYYLTGNGNLRSLITDEAKPNIKKLVLVGKSSSDDWSMIREMSIETLDMTELEDTVISDYQFQNCRTIKNLQLPNGLKQIGYAAFTNCDGLTYVELPESVKSINGQVFSGDGAINIIKVNSTNVPQANSDAFSGMSSNCNFIVPAGTVDAYKSADTWKDLANIYDVSVLPVLISDSKDITLYNADNSKVNQKQLSVSAVTADGVITPTVIWSSSDSNVASVSSDGLVKAGSTDGNVTISATYNYGEGKTVTLDFNVTNIDLKDGVLTYVETPGTLSALLTEDQKDNLKKLIVSGNLNNDDIRVLRYMAGRDENGSMTIGMLETLDMSSANIVDGGENGYLYKDGWWRGVGYNYFGEQIFENCTSLKKVILPNSLTSMSWSCFSGCSNLEEVVLPEGLYSLSSSSFWGCSKLKKVNIPSSLQNLPNSMFDGCSSLASVDLTTAKNLTSIESSCFSNSGLKSVVIPASVSTISSYAFHGCQLESVTFEEGSKIKTLESWSFSENSKLKSVNIPDGVTSIQDAAFYNDVQLENIGINENSQLSSIGSSAFYNCPIKSFYIPRRLYDLSNISFPSTMESITVNESNKMFKGYDGALYNADCDSLIYVPRAKNSLYLAPTTAKIGSSALNECGSLETIYAFQSTPATCTSASLQSVGANAIVYIPEGTLTAYQQTAWKSFNLVEVGSEPMVQLNKNSIKFYNINGGNDPVALTANIISINGKSVANVTWTSSNSNVASVAEDGTVSIGTQAGDAVITATATVDGKTVNGTCNVTTTLLGENSSAFFVTAGNLSSQITDEQKADIKDIVLFGTLNGSDIKFLREWAGCSFWSYEGNSDNNGTLKSIDMSNATIISGGEDICYGYHYNYDGNGNNTCEWTNCEQNIIGRNFFAGSNSLEKIILPENITAIYDCAFRNCTNLQTVTIPSSVRFIGSYAFDNCSALEGAFTIPTSVDSLGYKALGSYTMVYAKTTIPAKLSGDALVGDDGIVLVPASAVATYRTADNWKAFASRIFADNLDFKSEVDIEVTAGDDKSGLIDAIGSDDQLAFIQKLTLHGTINSYDIFAIRNRMPRLQSIDMSDVSIVASPYEYYTDSHTEKDRLGQNAFRDLNNLRSVILPKNITYIGYSAFNNCQNLRSVKIYDKVVTIDGEAFSNCYNLKDVEMQEGILSIGYNAFYNCYNLQEINLPSTIHTIGSWTFANCYSLKSLVLPKNLTAIEWYSFAWCNNLESVVIPSKVTRIDSEAFEGCNSLKELRIPPMVETIGDCAFGNCNAIKDVYVYIANPRDTKIDMNTFSCWTTATLHIPAFSYNAYYYDTQWGQFYTKVEFEADYESFYTKNTLYLNDETGTISGDPDATLYEQSGLEVEDETQKLTDVELKSDGNSGDGASLIAKGDGKITAENATIVIKVSQYQWHFFSFPYDIPLDSVKYVADNGADPDYVWRYYDGEKRSRKEGGWQDLAEGTTKLDKAHGYIFQGTETGELRIHLGKVEFEETDATTEVESHESDDAQDAGWNFIGNPYVSYYNVTADTYASPITIWDPQANSYVAYRPGDDDYSFAPYQAFFIQADTDAEVSFSSENQSSYEESQEQISEAKARRAAKKLNPSRILINLEITADGDSIASDKSRVVFNDKASLKYESKCDASKFFSETGKAQIYTVDGNGVSYAINERPMENGSVSMGVKANEAGTYYISAPRMDRNVWLVDNETGLTYDLSLGAYEFTVAKGTYANRFTIRISEEATSIEEFIAKTGISISTENGINITGAADDVAVKVFATSGAQVGNQIGNGTINVPAGVYILQVGAMPVKVLVK